MLLSITMHVQMHIHTSIKIFLLCSYRHIWITDKAACVYSKHDDQDDDEVNALTFINFCSSNFPNPDSSKISTIKILHRMVTEINAYRN